MHDHCCGWRKPKATERGFDALALLQLPVGEFAFSREVTVCAQGAVVVNDIEVAAGFPGNFGKEHFRRRKIEILGRKRFDEQFHMAGSQLDHDVGVESETGPTIGNCGESAD